MTTLAQTSIRRSSPRRRWRDNPFVDFAISQPLGLAGIFAILVMVVAATFAEFIAPYDPLAIDFEAMLAPPSLEHPFGTDTFGRDILTRIMYGARTALTIGFISSFVGCTLGAIIGLASAYYGGWKDIIVQRGIDLLLSFPIIVLALVVVAMLGRNRVGGIDINLICAITVPIIPRAARVVRSAALSIREMPYVDAARSAGYSSTRIILRHMAPNVLGPYLILVTAYIAQAILLEASLSFLGLGVNEPTPAWGLMLSGNSANFYQTAPWMILFPGAAISLAVFGFNLVGDALRDWLDPRLKT
jgi:peptide/nickel transport system permease protein